ncbi:MAG: ribosomal protein L7/L12 [Erythrobacter sp.]|nr:ribosomal protein L7/L12 [Erythrobacter sp.]
MLQHLDWTMVAWTAAVFVSGYFLGSRRARTSDHASNFDATTISPVARSRIDQALAKDAKIEAIRILRADTGLGLKDAKQVIDRWDASGKPGGA